MIMIALRPKELKGLLLDSILSNFIKACFIFYKSVRLSDHVTSVKIIKNKKFVVTFRMNSSNGILPDLEKMKKVLNTKIKSRIMKHELKLVTRKFPITSAELCLSF